MSSRYNRLKEVLIEGILAIDTYIESLSKFINKLEESKLENCKSEVQNLKSQNHSLLLTLNIIRDIKSKKLNLLKKTLNEHNESVSLHKFINIKINLNNFNNRDGFDKFINIKINLNDYNNMRNINKFINIKINLNNYYSIGNLNKIINIKMKLKDSQYRRT